MEQRLVSASQLLKKLAKTCNYQDTRIPMLKIVFVDDEKSVCEEVDEALSWLGCEVHTFVDPTDCWEFLVSNYEKVDVLVTDLMMPKIDGAELIQRCLSRFGCKMRFVLISGELESSVMLKKISPDIEIILPKPISITDLSKILEKPIF